MRIVDYKNLICPRCGKMSEVWNSKVNEKMFEGCCRNCLIDIKIEWDNMSHESIRELASE